MEITEEEGRLLEDVAESLLYYVIKEDFDKNKLNKNGMAYFLDMQLEHKHDICRKQLDQLFDLLDRLGIED